MSSHAEQLITQLHKVLNELESLAKSTAGTVSEEGDAVASRLKDTLASARSRILDAEHGLQRDVARGAHAADDYVHEHTWMSIGLAAAVGFLLGALSTRRE